MTEMPKHTVIHGTSKKLKQSLRAISPRKRLLDFFVLKQCVNI